VTGKEKSGAWVPGGKTFDVIQFPLQALTFIRLKITSPARDRARDKLDWRL
jgi:hypothetical protein